MNIKHSPISLWSKTWAEKRQIPYKFFSSTDSVNDSARKAAFKGAESPTVFITAEQTAGRGRPKKTWEDSDLMMAWLWEGTSTAYDVSGLDEQFAEDLLHAVQKIWPAAHWKIKKPNDLYLKNKKTAGILLEMLDQNPTKALIAGIGFNVFSHPPIPVAGHLREIITDISEKDWGRFLDQLKFLWTERVKCCLSL